MTGLARSVELTAVNSGFRTMAVIAWGKGREGEGEGERCGHGVRGVSLRRSCVSAVERRWSGSRDVVIRISTEVRDDRAIDRCGPRARRSDDEAGKGSPELRRTCALALRPPPHGAAGAVSPSIWPVRRLAHCDLRRAAARTLLCSEVDRGQLRAWRGGPAMAIRSAPPPRPASVGRPSHAVPRFTRSKPGPRAVADGPRASFWLSMCLPVGGPDLSFCGTRARHRGDRRHSSGSLTRPMIPCPTEPLAPPGQGRASWRGGEPAWMRAGQSMLVQMDGSRLSSPRKLSVNQAARDL